MKTVTFFNTIAELKQLTGLKHRGDLWSVGFNLDDWDWGFVSDTPWTNEPNVNYEWWLTMQMSIYHSGYEHVEYNGKHYYILYHS